MIAVKRSMSIRTKFINATVGAAKFIPWRHSESSRRAGSINCVTLPSTPEKAEADFEAGKTLGGSHWRRLTGGSSRARKWKK